MKLIALSDTHMHHKDLRVPDGDMVIHSGDASNQRTPGMNANEMLNFLDWYATLPHKYKIYSPGNHDTSIQAGLVSLDEFKKRKITLLIHQDIEIEGIKIFASPFTPEFGHGWAYNYPRHKMDYIWRDVPEDIDILITHGPPRTILDLTSQQEGHYFQCGCADLLRKVLEIEPKYHIFGHIHSESRCINGGMFIHPNHRTKFINASIVDIHHDVVNKPTIFDI